MMAIKAFVGHSFTKEDEEVVSSFLTFFGQLEALLDNFEWKHAKKAEPKELAEKVLETAEGCNTLIAICTRKELVVGEDALKPAFLDRTLVKASRAAYAWKTSDWVIQEIGLAIGRGMSVIILLETGCRKPGGLQGDIEYIPFERSAPERAQGQLLEMIKALSPSAASAPPKAGTTMGEEPQIDESAEPEQEKKPDASWDISEFENEFFWALFRDKTDRVDEINQAFLNSVHAKNDEEQAIWHATVESWKLIRGKGGSLSEIRKRSEAYPENAKILAALALALSHLDQQDEAARLYAQAAGFESDKLQALGHLSSAAYQYMRAGNLGEASAAIEHIKEIAEPGQEVRIAKALKSNAEAAADNHLKIEAMEAIARFEPDDQDNRFSLAYAHSEMGSPELALHHYLLIPSNERTPTAWNNLGVAYQNLSVPGRAISAYKESAGKGETLAMSNLAYRLMTAGFLDEANAEISRAMKASVPHRNVGEAYAYLMDLPESESKSVDDIEQKSRTKSNFYKELSEAILRPNVDSVARYWTGPKGAVLITINEGDFFAEWEFQTEGNALAGLLASKPSRHRVELRGKVIGRRAHGTLKQNRIDGTPSFLGESDSERSFAIIFNDKLNSAKVAENLEKRTPDFYELHLLDPQPSITDQS